MRPAAKQAFIDLESALGRRVGASEVDRAVVAAIQESFGVRLVAGSLTAAERAAAGRYAARKYSDGGWTRAGRAGAPPGSAA